MSREHHHTRINVKLAQQDFSLQSEYQTDFIPSPDQLKNIAVELAALDAQPA